MSSEPALYTDEMGGSIEVELPPVIEETKGEEEISASPVESTPPSTDTNVSAAGEGSDVTPATTPAPPKTIAIDASKLDAEIARLQREDKEFANAFNRAVGNKAANRYKPEIDRIVLENKIMARELRKQEILQMTPEERATKFRTDQDFANEYTAIVHSSPEQDQAEQTRLNFVSSLNSTVQSAIEDGVPQEYVRAVYQALQEGKFDFDENGRQLAALDSLPRITQALYRGLAVRQNGNGSQPQAASATPNTTTPAPNQASEAPRTNPNLLKGGPDTTTTGITKATPRDRSIADYQAALASGKTWASEDIDAITKKYLEME